MSTAVLCPADVRTAAGKARPVPGAAPLLPVVGADTQVPLVSGSSTRYVDLDAAASAWALTAVAARLGEALPMYSSVHRGACYFL